MRIVITGSIATDHLMTFPGRFADSLVVDQLDKISLSFLVDELEIRRGGVAANIAFGMGDLGQRPILVGAVGEDFADYRSWLERHGVDSRVGARLRDARTPPASSARPTTTWRQIATFYAGAMSEAREIELGPVADRVGGLDLVLDRAPTTPRRCAPHRGVPHPRHPVRRRPLPAAGPHATATRSACSSTGPTYLFTNEYEAALTEQKTGWTRRRDRRAGEHPGHHPGQGRRRSRAPAGEEPIEVGRARGGAPGRPDRGRRRVPGRLPRRAGRRACPPRSAPRWARCWPRTSSRRSGTQEYELGTQARFLDRLADGLRRARRPRRSAPTSPARALSPAAMPGEPQGAVPGTSTSTRWPRPGPGRRRRRPRARRRCSRRYRAGCSRCGWASGGAADRLVVAGPARRPAARPGARVSRSLRRSLPPVRRQRRPGVRRGRRRAAPTERGTGAGSPRGSPGAYARAAPAGLGALGRGLAATASWPAACTASRSAACSRASRCSTSRTDASKVALVALAELLAADGDPRRVIDVQWSHRAPGAPGHREVPREECPGAASSAAARGGRGADRRQPVGGAGLTGSEPPTRTVMPCGRLSASPRSLTSTQLVPAQPAPGRDVVRAAGSVGEQLDHERPGRHVAAARASRMTGSGQRRPRASTVDVPGPVTAAPSLGPDGGDGLGQRCAEPVHVGLAPGSTPGQRQGDPHVAVGERPHRGQDVAGRQGAGGARRPRGDREPRAVQLGDQRLAVDVEAARRSTMCGSRSGGRPTTSTSGSAAAAARIRSTSSGPAGVLLGAGSPRPAARPPRRRAPGGPPARRRCARPPASPAGPGRRQRVRSGTARTPTPAGPPHEWASPASTSYGRGDRLAAQGRQASTSSGMPGAAHRSLRRVERLEGAHLAVGVLHGGGCRARPRERGSASASRSTRPTTVHRDQPLLVGPRRRRGGGPASTAECSTAVATTRGAAPSAGVRSPSQPGAHGRRSAEAGRITSCGTHPQARRRRPRGPGRAAAGRRPASAYSRRGSAQPASTAA